MTTTVAKRAGPKCGAVTRQTDDPCKQPAGWGTDHVGTGRCKLHGGSTLKGKEHPAWKTGRYSSVKHESVRELVEQMAEDPDPLDTRAELDLMRALLHDWIDRYHELTEALMEWNRFEYIEAREEGRKPRPKRIPDIQEARPLIAEISKAVKRIQDARSQNAISRPELMRLMQEMARIVEHHVEDADAREAIKEGWLEIRVA